ncbi:hypothetical protein GCM10009611_13420 [Arthrobacter roseus]
MLYDDGTRITGSLRALIGAAIIYADNVRKSGKEASDDVDDDG